MLFANLRAFQLEQVFGAVQRDFESTVCVVQQGRVSQAPLALVLAGAGKAVRMHLAAETVELLLQGGKIDLKPTLQAEDLKVIAARRRLNLAAMRAEKRGVVVGHRTRPTSNR